MLAATPRIRAIFTNFLIRLEPEKVSAINRGHIGGEAFHVYEKIFSAIQVRFNFEIYFEYLSMKNELRVYCKRDDFKRV